MATHRRILHARAHPAPLACDTATPPGSLSRTESRLARKPTSEQALRSVQIPDLLPEPGTLPDNQPTTVAAAWSLSLDRADQLRPSGLARPMLQLAAMLDPNGISHEVLTSDPAFAHLAAHQAVPGSDRPAPESPAVSTEEATGALRVLHRMSLIDHIPNTPHQTVRVHQLIQRAMRDRLPADLYNQFARTAADALLAAWPDIERDTDLAQSLRANTDALTRHVEALCGDPTATTGCSLVPDEVSAGVDRSERQQSTINASPTPHVDTSAQITPTHLAPSAAWQCGGAMRVMRRVPQRHTQHCCPTWCGCWARTTAGSCPAEQPRRLARPGRGCSGWRPLTTASRSCPAAVRRTAQRTGRPSHADSSAFVSRPAVSTSPSPRTRTLRRVDGAAASSTQPRWNRTTMRTPEDGPRPGSARIGVWSPGVRQGCKG